ncbi:MAG: hypothetical protein HZA58_05185 [Acidimicrobiia bacterium]|nr:hypothetical protein [Acidimicrobiia bacterium]
MSRSTHRFERLVVRLLLLLVALLITAVVFVVATWPGDGGIFGLGAG